MSVDCKFWNLANFAGARRSMYSSDAASPTTPPRVQRFHVPRDEVKTPLAPLIRREILRPRNYEPSPTELYSFSHRFFTQAANDLINHTASLTSSNTAASDALEGSESSYDETQRSKVLSKENFGTVNEEKKRQSTNMEESTHSLPCQYESTRKHALEPTSDEGLNFHVRKILKRAAATAQNEEQEYTEIGLRTQLKD